MVNSERFPARFSWPEIVQNLSCCMIDNRIRLIFEDFVMDSAEFMSYSPTSAASECSLKMRSRASSACSLHSFYSEDGSIHAYPTYAPARISPSPSPIRDGPVQTLWSAQLSLWTIFIGTLFTCLSRRHSMRNIVLGACAWCLVGALSWCVTVTVLIAWMLRLNRLVRYIVMVFKGRVKAMKY